MAELAKKTELLPPIGASSKVWEYFGFPAKDGMVCYLLLLLTSSLHAARINKK